MIETNDVTRCDCQWTGDDIALDDLTPERPCGCGQHDVRIYRDQVWHWRDQHWTSGCLIVALSAAVRDGESVASAPRKEAVMLAELARDAGEAIVHCMIAAVNSQKITAAATRDQFESIILVALQAVAEGRTS